MKAAMRNPRYTIALSLLAALVVVLVAWLAPLPRLVLGEEAAAATRMPQTRSDVAQARSNFEQGAGQLTKSMLPRMMSVRH